MSLRNFVRYILILFLLRLALSLLPSFWVDMGAWLAWSERLRSLPLHSFYSSEVWTQYTPGYLYYLYIVGKLGLINPLAIKISVIVADIFLAHLIWKIVTNGKSGKYWIYAAYVLNPVVIFDGSIWGQIDGILTLFMVLSVYFLSAKKNPVAAGISYAIALLIKPQALAIAPIIAVITLQRLNWREIFSWLVSFFCLQILGYWPFYPSNPVRGMIELVGMMSESYPYTSLFAFNLWGIVGMWINDLTLLRGVSYREIGVMLTAVFSLIVIVRFFRPLKSNKLSYLVAMLFCMIFYLLPTRVHERYMFPALAFGYIAFIRDKDYWGSLSLILLSVLMTFNLYLPYSIYESSSNSLTSIFLEQEIKRLIPVITTLYYLIFGLILFKPYRQVGKILKSKSQ